MFARISISFGSFLDSCVIVCAGCSLLQRVQAEIRLLQEEIEETSKKRFFKICLGLLGSCWGTKLNLVKASLLLQAQEGSLISFYFDCP